MQGFLGATLGAAVGGAVAALVARYTVKQMRVVERESAREARREAAAVEIYRALQAVGQALGGYRVGVEVAPEDISNERWWTQKVKPALAEFHRLYVALRPAMYGPLGRQLVEAQLLTFGLESWALKDSRYPDLESTRKAEAGIGSALDLLVRYLSDPVPVLDELRRAEAKTE
jgi:gas vesicle protein